VIFHDPIEPENFGSRDELMDKVRIVIDSGLPPEMQTFRSEVRGASQAG